MVARIRERRLDRLGLILAAAISALEGCSARISAPDAVSPEAVPRVAEIPAPPGADVEPAAPAHETRIRPDLPSLATPQGVSGRARARYEELARKVVAAHELMDGMDIPACSVTSCESRWKTLAEKQRTARLAYSFVCAGSSEEAKTYAELESVHMKFLSDRYTELDAEIAEAAGSELRRYEKLKAELERAHPATPSEECVDW